MSLNSYDIIILDCDGVLLDSNRFKLEAMREVTSSWGDDVSNRFIDYAKQQFGSSRFIIFKYFFENILKQTIDEESLTKLLLDYGELCIKKYKECEETPFLRQFLKLYQDKELHVASGSKEDELRQVFNEKQLSHYFQQIYGSPKKKSDIVHDIIIKNKNAVLIGDSQADYDSAAKNDIDFIFMKEFSNIETIIGAVNKTINNLGDLI